jgi:hypothetical protein
MGYQSVTRTAKAFGRTVQQMKLILAEEGLLAENGPTETALESGAAKMCALDPETAPYGAGARTHYPKWDYETVKGLMARRGEAPGDRKVVIGAHAALTAFGKVGDLMAGMPGMDRDLIDDLRHSGHAGSLGLAIFNGETKGILTEFRKTFEATRATAARKRGRWKGKGQEIIAWLDALEAFLVRQDCT